MNIPNSLLTGGFSFGRNAIGIIVRPYETYRRIVDRENVWELWYLAFLLVVYFALASIIKTASFRPFLLTQQFVLLISASGMSFLLTVALLWFVAGKFGGKGALKGFLVAWGYTMVPTFVWFLSTSLLYVLLPPPRTTRPEGILFSIVYLVFSATLFFWKAQLAYLALRFGLRMDLGKILLTWVIVGPLLGLYSIAMYRLGIFRIPFL